MRNRMVLAVLILFFQRTVAQENRSLKMSGFIGINSNIAAYDQKYLPDLAKCAKWIREYHSWAHYEVADNYYKWDNITTHPQGYTWPDHNKFMDECKKLGINVLIDVLDKPVWAGTARGAYSKGDGTKASDYLDKLEFIGQLVARYGSQKIDKSKLETADKVSGLNYIRYFEDDNEPDYWWETPQWPAEKYAVYCNAVHDANGVEATAEYPLLGIKSVDSTAFHVLGGLAKNDVTYLQKIIAASKGRVPFDVINVHTYCTDDKDGYSPENESYGIEKKLGFFVEWCKKNLPGKPLWLTEFGWDTFIDGTKHSYVYAPPAQQANYILRAYLVALKMGFEKAFLFMDKDPESANTLQYSSSGIISDQATGLSKKTSFYYLATMQKILSEAVFDRVVSWREPAAGNEIYCIGFLRPNNETVFVIWARAKNSKTDLGIKLNYKFSLNYQPEYAYIVRPGDKNLEGAKTEIALNGKDIELELTETPLFLTVAQNKTSLHIENRGVNFNVYPNPANNEVQLTFNNPKLQRVNISAYNTAGKLAEMIANRQLDAGNQNFTFGKNLAPGLYIIRVDSEEFGFQHKVVIR